MNYPTARAGGVSVLNGECLRLDLRPFFGLTSPATAPDGRSTRLLHSDTFIPDIGRCISVSVVMSAALSHSPLSHTRRIRPGVHVNFSPFSGYLGNTS
ncbi:hypothetical protein MiSe_94660 [Microseira wollei NIES-4236]|uniref:Uncharacterized protein n=1 Tax=Microseira wollei NIES-4236 TaxID=2530354 RepID=A0AAV3XU80_9CYAN|nr:hypothetical protein MiSe_94660 [Microseira wollei NIES-4236]